MAAYIPWTWMIQVIMSGPLPLQLYVDHIQDLDLCVQNCISGDLYCFGRGRMDVKCYDDHMEGYGSGSMGYGSGSMGSGYGSGSMGYGSGSMGSGYGMGSGMESGYGYGSEGYGPGGYGSEFSSTSPSA